MKAEDLIEILRSHGIRIPVPVPVESSDPASRMFQVKVGARTAVPAWYRLRKLTHETGFYPVVCADPDGQVIGEPKENGPPVAEVIEQAEKVLPSEWFSGREQSDPEVYGDVQLGEWLEFEDDDDESLNWTVPFDALTKEPLDHVWILFVPTPHPWEVLAHLRYGGWNECPLSHEHVAIQRDWFYRFGAEIVTLSGDVVEMHVAAPPEDREKALALAKEQFVYTGGDLIFQGFGELRKLASCLVGQKNWYFWWD